MAQEDENFLSKAFRIIAAELPQFFTQTNTPFLGKDQEGSVMKEDTGADEKKINENLLKLSALALPVGAGAAILGRAAMAAPKLAGAVASGGTFAVTKDPLDLIPGKLGAVIGSSSDAEAMIIPAAKIKTADAIKNALLLKDTLTAQGMPAAEAAAKTYYRTGIYNDTFDDVARAVISDQPVSLYTKEAGTLSSILHHPELFKAMPELRDLQVKHLTPEQAKTLKGGYHPAENTIYINPQLDNKAVISTILHETQHAIQNKNKMIVGGNPTLEETSNRFAEAYDKATLPMKGLPGIKPSDYSALYDRIRRDLYRRGAGEAEARATQTMWETGNYTVFPLEERVGKFSPYDIPLDRRIKPATEMYQDF